MSTFSELWTVAPFGEESVKLYTVYASNPRRTPLAAVTGTTFDSSIPFESRVLRLRRPLAFQLLPRTLFVDTTLLRRSWIVNEIAEVGRRYVDVSITTFAYLEDRTVVVPPLQPNWLVYFPTTSPVTGDVLRLAINYVDQIPTSRPFGGSVSFAGTDDWVWKVGRAQLSGTYPYRLPFDPVARESDESSLSGPIGRWQNPVWIRMSGELWNARLELPGGLTVAPGINTFPATAVSVTIRRDDQPSRLPGSQTRPPADIGELKAIGILHGTEIPVG